MVMFFWAGSFDWRERFETATIKKPAENRNKKDKRPEKLFQPLCLLVENPHSKNQRNTDPKADDDQTTGEARVI